MSLTKVTLNREALEMLTESQAKALGRLCTQRVETINVQQGGFGLPARYVSFSLNYDDGSTPIYGGIDPSGSVST